MGRNAGLGLSTHTSGYNSFFFANIKWKIYLLFNIFDIQLRWHYIVYVNWFYFHCQSPTLKMVRNDNWRPIFSFLNKCWMHALILDFKVQMGATFLMCNWHYELRYALGPLKILYFQIWIWIWIYIYICEPKEPVRIRLQSRFIDFIH